MASPTSAISMPGRKPIPKEVKTIKGTLQQCRVNQREPGSDMARGAAPDYMSVSAKSASQYAVTNAPVGLLSALDGSVLERWANCAGMYREALSKINRAGVSGMIIKTPSGILRLWPLMDVIRDLDMKGYGTEMGFTPAARSRVSVQMPASDRRDPWDDIAG
jgi:P27 family predicted phage terminase small subunit